MFTLTFLMSIAASIGLLIQMYHWVNVLLQISVKVYVHGDYGEGVSYVLAKYMNPKEIMLVNEKQTGDVQDVRGSGFVFRFMGLFIATYTLNTAQENAGSVASAASLTLTTWKGIGTRDDLISFIHRCCALYKNEKGVAIFMLIHEWWQKLSVCRHIKEQRHSDLLKTLLCISAKVDEANEAYFHDGVLLYGEPGAGKTYLVEQFAQSSGRTLYLATSAISTLDDTKLNNMMRGVKARCIILFDDCECLVDRMKPTANDTTKLTRSALLGCIDGYLTPRNCIFFFVQMIEHASHQ